MGPCSGKRTKPSTVSGKLLGGLMDENKPIHGPSAVSDMKYNHNDAITEGKTTKVSKNK